MPRKPKTDGMSGELLVETTKRKRLQAALEYIAMNECARHADGRSKRCLQDSNLSSAQFCTACFAKMTLKSMGIRKKFLRSDQDGDSER